MRPPTYDDGPALHAVLSDPEVCRYLPQGPTDTLAVTRHVIALCVEAMPRGIMTYAMCLQGAVQHPFGLLQVQCPPGSDEAELGVVLGREAWGKGFAREGFRAVRLAAPAGAAMRFHGGVDAQNTRALAMLGKIGLAAPETRPGYRVHPTVSPEPRTCLLFQARIVDRQIAGPEES